MTKSSFSSLHSFAPAPANVFKWYIKGSYEEISKISDLYKALLQKVGPLEYRLAREHGRIKVIDDAMVQYLIYVSRFVKQSFYKILACLLDNLRV